MDSLFFPFFLIVFSALFGGTWGLGMKYMKPLAFEAWWLIYALVALILIPWIWAMSVIPDLWDTILSVPPGLILTLIVLGLLWGASNILFGHAVRYVGVSITYGIVMGLGALMGSIVPLFMISGSISNPAVPIIFAGVLVLLTGIGINAMAGLRRDKLQQTGEAGQGGAAKSVQLGLLLTIICGVMAALMNIGFARGAPIALAAEAKGALTRNASLAVWVVLCSGSFLTNASYAVILMTKNKTWKTYASPGMGKGLLAAVLTGLGFFAGAGIYGQGAFLLGEIGPVVGWPIHLSVVIIVSNVWGFITGEWKGAMGPFRLIMLSVLVFIAAMFLLGYANKLFYSL